MRALGRKSSQLHAVIDVIWSQAFPKTFACQKASLPVGLNLLADLLDSKAASEHHARVYSSRSTSTSEQWQPIDNDQSRIYALDQEDGDRSCSGHSCGSKQNSADVHSPFGPDQRWSGHSKFLERGQPIGMASSMTPRMLGERLQHTQARQDEERSSQLSTSQPDQPTVQPSPASQLQVGFLRLLSGPSDSDNC